MEIRIDRQHLLQGLHLAQGIAARKGTMPILANVLLRTDGKDKLLCAATDLAVTVMTTVPAKVAKEGGLTVAARQIYEITKGLATDQIDLRRTDQNYAEIKAGRSEFKVVGMLDRDFPKLPAVAEATTSKIDSAVLREMIAKTFFSVSQDETRQHLAGILLESDGQTMRMVSTDGHRLSKVERAVPGAPNLPSGVIIPRKGAAEIRRALEGREAPSSVGVFQGQFVLRADDVCLAVKLGDGQFPPYDQVLPKDNDRVVLMSRDAFFDALKRVSILASDKTWGVRLSLEKGRLSIETDNPDLGSAREHIEVDYKGTPLQIGFNAHYFMELLTEMTVPEIRMELAGELDPALVRPADSTEHVGVVMPMRL